MTVKQLMQKLKTVPEDYEVTIHNTHLYVEGWYKTDGIYLDEKDKQVEITADYKHRWDYETGEWN